MSDSSSTTKSSQGRFFEDFELGQEIECPIPRAITAGEVALYIALCGDRTPRYCGAEGLVHPLITFHQVLGQTVRDVSLNARANLGYAGLRWLRPVRVGAVLRTTATVIGLKENSSGKHGVVWLDTRGSDEEGEVLRYTRWVMVYKRGAEPTPWAKDPVRPELPECVAASELTIAVGALPSRRDTGGAYAFEDYAVGERVEHHDAQTVTPSSHMGFTRLFQNTARVHFDARQSEPLVFGGYVMSIGYAQAFNGFQNRLGIAAINGGKHTAPVHAGDTLTSSTEVLEVDALGDGPVGALRCRLVVLKIGARETPVLELDFWELMPKREAL